MKSERLIRRYEHNHFRGWVVSTKRRGRRYTKYFSDKPGGPASALRRARRYRDDLLKTLPIPTKIKRSYVLNKTGVIGVTLSRDRTRSGRVTWRYAATWPTRDGRSAKKSFSITRYGKAEARRLAIQARQQGLAALLGLST